MGRKSTSGNAGELRHTVSQSNKLFDNSGLFAKGPEKPKLEASHKSLADDPQRNHGMLSDSFSNKIIENKRLCAGRGRSEIPHK